MRLYAGVSEEDPTLDTLVSVWLGADWFEREAFDLYGVRFKGHPDLRRILMYPEFVGHPLRKDYPKEKRQPLIRREPGKVDYRRLKRRRERHGEQHDCDPRPPAPSAAWCSGLKDASDLDEPELPSETMTLNMGPSHPAMHGTFRMVLELDGETIVAPTSRSATCTAASRRRRSTRPGRRSSRTPTG